MTAIARVAIVTWSGSGSYCGRCKKDAGCRTCSRRFLRIRHRLPVRFLGTEEMRWLQDEVIDARIFAGIRDKS